MAADEVLCPVALQAPSMEGLKTFFGYLMSAQRLNQGLELRYILPTLFDRRTRQSFEIYRQLKRLFQKQICEPIRYNVRLSEAPGVGKSIFEYQKNATGAVDYARLIRRIISDDGRKKGFP
jgi:chromosome partitioning protein